MPKSLPDEDRSGEAGGKEDFPPPPSPRLRRLRCYSENEEKRGRRIGKRKGKTETWLASSPEGIL